MQLKLPINVTVRGDDDWRDCLRASFEHLNDLQEKADQSPAWFSVKEWGSWLQSVAECAAGKKRGCDFS